MLDVFKNPTNDGGLLINSFVKLLNYICFLLLMLWGFGSLEKPFIFFPKSVILKCLLAFLNLLHLQGQIGGLTDAGDGEFRIILNTKNYLLVNTA